jgi:D-3-phosphoglycerate dehydrogenase
MNVFAVGDALLPEQYVKDGLKKFIERGDQINVISWGEDDEAIIDQRARVLELNGPTADTPPEELEKSIADTELLMVHYCPVSEALLKKATNLKILATCRMGTQNIDVPAATQLGILTFHVIGRTTEAVSDLTVGLMLCEARNIARAHKAMTDGSWRKVYLNSATAPEFEAKIVGLVGFGEVGRAVMRKLKCFNMKFMVYDPFVAKAQIEKLGGEPVDLDTLLASSDFISLHATVTDKASNMIDAREISLMKPTAYLINTARAELINEKALIDALKDNRISGAAMDVFKDEPLPPEHPFLELDNVTLTPHIASSTLECLAKSPRLLVDEILNFFKTGRSRFIVNPELLEKFSAEHFMPKV